MTENDEVDICEITVRDWRGPQKLGGQLLGENLITYAEALRGGYERWTDCMLYRVEDSEVAFRYVIQTVARSLVYHRVGGPCSSGGERIRVRVARLDAERFRALTMCTEPGCAPGDLDTMAPDDAVSAEQDRPYLVWCETASNVVHALMDKHPRTGIPVLRMASRIDADLDDALAEYRRL